MQMLVPLGAVVTLLGVLGLLWCVILVRRARAEKLDETAMRARLQRVVAVNMAALFLSAIGLMIVVTGIILS